MSKRSTSSAWLRDHAEQAPLAAVWAAGAALTAVGMYSVAMACGIPGQLAWLYPLIFDGLALVAYRATSHTKDGACRYAAFVVVLCTGLSALAQAAHLAAGTGLTAAADGRLKAGVGAAPAIAVALAAHLHWLTTRPAKPAATQGSVAAPGQRGGSLDTSPASLPGQPATSGRPGLEVAPGQDGPPAVPAARPVPAPADRTGGHAEPSVRSLTHAEDTTGRQVYLAAVSEDTKDTPAGVPARTPRGRRARAAGTPRPHRVVAPLGVPEDAELVERLRVLRRDTEDTLTTVRPVANALHIGKERARRVLELDATTPPPEGAK